MKTRWEALSYWCDWPDMAGSCWVFNESTPTPRWNAGCSCGVREVYAAAKSAMAAIDKHIKECHGGKK